MLNETANNVSNSLEATVIIRRYEDIITKTKNKKAIGYIGKQEEDQKSSRTLKTFLII